MQRVSIIGMGRMGRALALSLPSAGYPLDRLFVRQDGRSLPDELAKFAAKLDETERVDSDIVFITTRDNEIEAAASALAETVARGAVVFHTSGSKSSAALEVLKRAGCSVGSLHPLVSVSDPSLGPERFAGSFFCIEGDDKAAAIGNEIAAALGGKPFSIDTKFKTLYHASAVTACGHLVALFDAAVEMMGYTGLSPEKAKEILLPLVSSTVDNLERQSTSEALTGTFARADSETFTKHIGALNEFGTDELLEIYLLLGERSLELASRQGVSAERIETLRAKVAIAKSKMKW
jgi:predicted short-subunit dehydrogenase-like oxidoreductase (DUF2520 family)